MRRIIYALGAAISAALVSVPLLLASTPAGAATSFTIWERFGTQAVGAPNLNAGTDMTEVSHPGRTITYNNTTTYLGDGAGTLRVSSGNYLASDSNCNFVFLTTSPSANGTIWANHFSGGSLFWINRRCDQQFGGPDTQALAGFNQNGRRFTICGLPFDCSGLFRAMQFGN